jgi:hypothetical protein
MSSSSKYWISYPHLHRSSKIIVTFASWALPHCLSRNLRCFRLRLFHNLLAKTWLALSLWWWFQSISSRTLLGKASSCFCTCYTHRRISCLQIFTLQLPKYLKSLLLDLVDLRLQVIRIFFIHSFAHLPLMAWWPFYHLFSLSQASLKLSLLCGFGENHWMKFSSSKRPYKAATRTSLL